LRSGPFGKKARFPGRRIACAARAENSACLLSGLAEPIGYALLRPYLPDAVFGSLFGMIGGMALLALDELRPAAKRYASSHETVYGQCDAVQMRRRQPRSIRQA
jgi:hypothetical protein